MPLINSTSKEALSKNIETEVNAGKDPKQAAAIAYAQGKDDQGSKRVTDVNGWYEVKNNPLSKEGVFGYTGASLGGAAEGYEPDKIYQVYRPASELADPECINSFKLIPWVNDHTMLGASTKGLTPVERKGAEGVIGEDVYFKDGVLYGNIKVWSEQLADLIDEGKEELSCGYRCLYKKQSGVYNGIHYDVIQTRIRGNHLALVDEGRMGKEVAVMDSFKFTIDSKEIVKMPDENKKAPMTLEELGGHVNKMMDMINTIKGAQDAMIADKKAMDDKATADKKAMDDKAAADKKAKDKKAKDDEEEMVGDKKAKDKDDDNDDDDSDEGEDKKGMDAKEVEKFVGDSLESFKKEFLTEGSQRTDLANKLSAHVGTFDHADKSLKEIVEYGIEKLGITGVAKGQEKAALDGFFFAQDAIAKKSAVGYGLDTSGDKAAGAASFIVKK